MPASEHAVDLVASAILDGTPIDWTAVEANATEAERQLLEELRLLNTVAAIQREVPPSDGQQATSGGSGHMQYWGRLRLIERVGGGTFGDVYRAWDPRLDREVALKLIPAAPAGERDSHGRSAAIIREGRLLARVRHPGVVTIYDAEQIETRVGLCMEFVEGPTLEGRLTQHGTFSAGETVGIGVQLCDALSAAHNAGVLHRDVKAANVVARDDGRVVLMDFGAGRELDDAFAADLTGTPLYVAPEVMQGCEATARSDIYSLGVLLYHLLTGSYPVQARSVSELRLAHKRRLEGVPAGRSGEYAGIPSRLASVIERAIDPAPERRYDSAAAVGRDLRALQKGNRSRGWYTLCAAALVAVVVGAGLFLVARGSRPFGIGSGGAAAKLVSQSPEPVRIAILPFAVSGEASDSRMLQEGMTRDLIARLQSFDNVLVISTASVLSLDTQNLPLREIATRLGVSAAVTGGIVRSGEEVAVDVKLLRLPDEHNLWEQQYNRTMAARLEIPRAIAQDLAGALGLRRERAVTAWPTRSPDAAALYVRGRTEFDKFTPDGLQRALKLFEAALEIDPDYADVHAALAQVYLQNLLAVPEEEAVRRATQAAGRAMSLDPWLPESYVAAAAIKSTRADWDGADRDFQRAIELGPSNVHARQQYAHWLSRLGRFEKAIEQARMAELLDPISPRAIMSLASVFRFARRFEEAIQQSQKALSVDPDYLTAYFNLGHSYQGLGRLTEAIEAYERMGRPTGNLGNAYAQAGHTDKARALIALFEAQYAKTGVGAGHIAQIYCGLGEIENAFEWLERSEPFYGGWPTTYKVAAVWDPLRGDPRFALLLKKAGLAD